MKRIIRLIGKELSELFNTFYKGTDNIIDIRCLALYNDYQPSRGDEVVTYKYKFHITINNKLFVYDGWCYKEDLDQLALGIYSHWLLKHCKIYDGKSTAWYSMYTCLGNITSREEDFE